MLGGAQDNATPLASGDLTKWMNVGGGDGGFTAINPANPKVQYATSQYLTIYRTEDNWKDWDPDHRGNSEITYYDQIGGNTRAWLGDTTLFIAPIVLDPADPNILYAATNFLWRWDERKTPHWADHLGGQMLSSGVDDAVTVIAISPSDHKRIYTGSQTGQIWMTPDAGETWSRIDDGLPRFWITSISVQPSDPDTILVGLSGTGDANTSHPGHLWKCVHSSSTTPVVVVADVASPFMLGQVNFPYPVADAVFDDVPSPSTFDNTSRARNLCLHCLRLRAGFKRCPGLNDRQP